MRTTPATSWWQESTIVILLALPIIANGLLESGASFTNVFLVAHLGTTQLAANALVSGLFTTLMVIFWGLISAVSIVIAHYYGANHEEGIAGTLRAGIYLSLCLSLPIMLLLWFAPLFFQWSGQSSTLITDAKQYLHALIWAVPADLVGFTLMQFFPGISRPKITFYFTVIYLPLMLTINYLLIFGKCGLPQMGLAGIGWGTTIAYSVILLINFGFMWKTPYYRHFLQLRVKTLRPYLSELLRVGIPLGFTYSIELGYFFIVALCIGKISNTALAAYQIMLQYFWLNAICSYSFGQALTIRLGRHMGENQPQWLFPLYALGQSITFIYSTIIAMVCLLFPHTLMALDLGYYPPPQSEFTLQTVNFFRFLALFQFLDNVRSISLSLLRGLKDTKFTLILAIITFLGVALPLGYVSCFYWMNKNPWGLWLGLIVGHILAIGLSLYRIYFWHKKIRRPKDALLNTIS